MVEEKGFSGREAEVEWLRSRDSEVEKQRFSGREAEAQW